ncbi:DPH3-like protein [Hibiscus syriacus]|uniref:Diphthamide biosynthesis protein 3 n=1 Tax=Hibiscus syriacus TaxID=106335 RepID=A0A6A3CD42_HIBSY|nr:DPH3-like protein [Hibiscus syriacus]
MSYDDVEIEDMQWNEELQAYTYPCPCGDLFQITKEDLKLSEEIARCPSCSLYIRSSTTPRTSPTTNLRTVSILRKGKPSPLLEALKGPRPLSSRCPIQLLFQLLPSLGLVKLLSLLLDSEPVLIAPFLPISRSTYCHVVVDGESFMRFMRTWTSIYRMGSDSSCLDENPLPLIDKDVIKDPGGDMEFLVEGLLALVSSCSENPISTQDITADRVRATFVLSPVHAERPKHLVMAADTEQYHTCLDMGCTEIKETMGHSEKELKHGVLPVLPLAGSPLTPSVQYGIRVGKAL